MGDHRGGSGTESMAAVLAGLKSVDFYRKLKRDLQGAYRGVRCGRCPVNMRGDLHDSARRR